MKPLVIKVKPSSVPNGESGRWNELSNIETFTRDIETKAIDSESDISPLVSGIPSPFARVNLFKLALDYYGRTENNTPSNLNGFYAQLSNEWRGFIACIALDYPRITAERIYLAYTDGKDFRTTQNIYEPKGAFGRMLFDRKPLWCEQENRTDEAHKGVPFIDVISYDGVEVGATSPDTILFTSGAYHIQNTTDRPWIDSKTQKFTDPIRSKELDGKWTLQLYAYVNYLIEGQNGDGNTGINALGAYYGELCNDGKNNSLIPNYGNLTINLQNWRDEIKAYASSKGFDLSKASIPPINSFMEPFSLALNYKDELFGVDGVISSDQTGNAVSFNPKDLLLPGTARIARIIMEGPNKDNQAKFPVYVLSADVKNAPGEKAYFAMPLSAKGISVFGKNISALVERQSVKANVDSRLTAVFDPDVDRDNLEVTLHLEMVDGRTKDMKETYTCGGVIYRSRVIMWPNFIHGAWHRYFMYSELPHNVNLKDYPFQAVPFVGDPKHEFRTITRGTIDPSETTKDPDEPIFLAVRNDDPKSNDDVDVDWKEGIEERHLETSIHVAATAATADNPYKYEIYECNMPFKGIKVQTPDGHIAGYFIIRYSISNDPDLPQNLLSITDMDIKGTTLGVDFGSTNTSIAYLDPRDSRAKGLNFHNRRVSLLRAGEPADNDVVAKEDTLLFFQANPIRSNSIKSTLTLHDPRRVTKDINENLEIERFEKEVKGGFPCFSRNLPVDTVNERSIQLMCKKIGQLNQIYNMKWDDDERNTAYKEAYLRSLLLHVYAELFDLRLFPKRLKWSYPSAMSESLLSKYYMVWDSLPAVNPLNDVNNHKPVNKDEKYELEISHYGYKIAASSTKASAANSNSANDDDFLGVSDFNDTQSSDEEDFDLGDDLFADDVENGKSENENKPVDFVKDDDDKQISFNPVPLVNSGEFESMTEACAVANYLGTDQDIMVDDRNALTVCFDIGGSTTDISALCMLKAQAGNRMTMIKQNSIHFAAQLVANATSRASNFEKVLNTICGQYGLHIQGLNVPPLKYSSDTAPYYFEQMVDRLDSSQLPEFYKKVNAYCPELMCVDVYVTGLILYYAGILTRKLIKQVRSSSECCWDGKPKVNITFAGKGARIMEWLSIACSPGLAKKYYSSMFAIGLGKTDYGKFISNLIINFPKTVSEDVKYEVSKGLAIDTNDLMRPSDNKPIEVIGEDGFTMENLAGEKIKLDADNSITPEMMASIGDRFYGSSMAGTRFREFFGIFVQIATKILGVNIRKSDCIEALKSMNLMTFIKNTPEYLHAKRNKEFDFVAPVLILEGEKFYKDFIMKKICK